MATIRLSEITWKALKKRFKVSTYQGAIEALINNERKLRNREASRNIPKPKRFKK